MADPHEDTAAALDRAVEAMLDLAATRGWAGLSLAEVAEAAGMTLAGLRALAPGKGALVAAYLDRIDRATLDGGVPTEGTPRDRLFDVAMRRFDALAPRKAAILAILGGLRTDPGIALSTLPGAWRSLGWMLEAAGIDAAGLSGLARRKGLAAVCANAFRVWLEDDTPDMAKTMTALDQGLRHAERLARWCGLDDADGEPETAAPPRERPAP